MKSSIILVVLVVVAGHVSGHGRLWDPPSRSTIWKYPEYSYLPNNYNDNELFCGGYAVQYYQNGGRCGVCGDNFADSTPRANENGGTYGRGVVARTYSCGQQLNAVVEITSNHLGYFEFALCPRNADGSENADVCFSLELADGSGTKFPIGSAAGYFTVPLKLPANFYGENLTFQWTYTTGNSWGWCDPEQTVGAVGCGDQETFRGCADIKINNNCN